MRIDDGSGLTLELPHFSLRALEVKSSSCSIELLPQVADLRRHVAAGGPAVVVLRMEPPCTVDVSIRWIFRCGPHYAGAKASGRQATSPSKPHKTSRIDTGSFFKEFRPVYLSSLTFLLAH